MHYYPGEERVEFHPPTGEITMEARIETFDDILDPPYVPRASLRMPPWTRCAGVSTMRRALQLGQKPRHFLAERHQLLVPVNLEPDAQESVFEALAFEVRFEHFFHVTTCRDRRRSADSA